MRLSPHHTIATKCLLRATIALVQLLVMVTLAMPSSYQTVVNAAQESASLTTAGAMGGDHNDCPCCPGDDSTDTDDCSKCSYCSGIPIPVQAISTAYTPVVANLFSHEQITRLPDVHIPILVPPQNLA